MLDAVQRTFQIRGVRMTAAHYERRLVNTLAGPANDANHEASVATTTAPLVGRRAAGLALFASWSFALIAPLILFSPSLSASRGHVAGRLRPVGRRSFQM